MDQQTEASKERNWKNHSPTSKRKTSHIRRAKWNGKEYEKTVMNHWLAYMLGFIISLVKCSPSFGNCSFTKWSNWNKYCCTRGSPTYFMSTKNNSSQKTDMRYHFIWDIKQQMQLWNNHKAQMGQSPAVVPLQVVLNVKNEGNRGEKKKRERGERVREGERNSI